MIAPVETKTYTAQEYLEAEVNSQERHEFLNGEIILMAVLHQSRSIYGNITTIWNI